MVSALIDVLCILVQITLLQFWKGYLKKRCKRHGFHDPKCKMFKAKEPMTKTDLEPTKFELKLKKKSPNTNFEWEIKKKWKSLASVESEESEEPGKSETLTMEQEVKILSFHLGFFLYKFFSGVL